MAWRRSPSLSEVLSKALRRVRCDDICVETSHERDVIEIVKAKGSTWRALEREQGSTLIQTLLWCE